MPFLKLWNYISIYNINIYLIDQRDMGVNTTSTYYRYLLLYQNSGRVFPCENTQIVFTNLRERLQNVMAETCRILHTYCVFVDFVQFVCFFDI